MVYLKNNKEQLISNWSSKVEKFRRLKEGLGIAKAVVRKLDGKVINIRLEKELNGKLKGDNPVPISAYLARGKFGIERSVRIIAQENSGFYEDAAFEVCQRKTEYDTYYGNKVLKCNNRIDAEATVADIEIEEANLDGKIGMYEDAIANYDKYEKMNEELDAYVRNYRKNVNSLHRIEV